MEIRWVSNDHDYYEQQNGLLPDFYSKKDETTTFFTFNMCEFDLQRVLTLSRVHCKSTQHILKVLWNKNDWRVKLKKEAGIEVENERFKKLFERLDQAPVRQWWGFIFELIT